MQDEVNEKVISICINGGKISARILKNSVSKALADMEQEEKRKQQNQRERKNQRQHKKSMKKEQIERQGAYKGKQSIRKLKAQNFELSNIAITGNNIKSFEKYARKYNIDYSLQKNRSAEPPQYFVFFKAKDVDSMTAAFKEYTGWQMKKSNKVSIRKKLSLAKERIAKHKQREKTKSKERDTAR